MAMKTINIDLFDLKPIPDECDRALLVAVLAEQAQHKSPVPRCDRVALLI